MSASHSLHQTGRPPSNNMCATHGKFCTPWLLCATTFCPGRQAVFCENNLQKNTTSWTLSCGQPSYLLCGQIDSIGIANVD